MIQPVALLSKWRLELEHTLGYDSQLEQKLQNILPSLIKCTAPPALLDQEAWIQDTLVPQYVWLLLELQTLETQPLQFFPSCTARFQKHSVFSILTKSILLYRGMGVLFTVLHSSSLVLFGDPGLTSVSVILIISLALSQLTRDISSSSFPRRNSIYFKREKSISLHYTIIPLHALLLYSLLHRYIHSIFLVFQCISFQRAEQQQSQEEQQE